MREILLSALFLSPLLVNGLRAETEEPNYSEEKVPLYSLPDPLFFQNGRRVKEAAQWPKRRAEILHLFEEHVYGKTPVASPDEMKFVEKKKVDNFLNGKATLREVRILFTGKEDGPFLDLLIISPKNADGKKSPAFLTVNFKGNHTVHSSKEITLNQSWVRESGQSKKDGVTINHRSTEKSRGIASSRWAVEKIIDNGIALATWYYGDVDPDFDDGFENGIHATYGKPKPNEWGSIGSWAWGFSRALDYLETTDDINAKQVAVMGHSRLGKTALWAGARDQRFALVISNDSGCGGAALSRRRFGEKVKRINTSFPHWFCDNFQKYNDNEARIPVDQHQLISLIAPRAVYIASAKEDEWADPKGEFLSALHADPVYRLLGSDGLGGATEHPAANKPVGKTVRYHVRTGKHDVTDYDWDQYIKAMKDLVIIPEN